MSYESRFDRFLETTEKGDKQGAFFQLLRLATEGHQDRYVEVGLAYETGWGTTPDVNKAIEWYEKAAHDARDQEGFLALGRLYYHGVGVYQDYEKALWYYDVLVEAGNPIACSAAANMYGNGPGTSQDMARARELFEKGAALGSIPCAKALSLFLLTEGSRLRGIRILLSAWCRGALMRLRNRHDERLRRA